MLDPNTAAALADLYRAADERQRRAIRDTAAILGTRGALAYLERVDRERRAILLLRQGMKPSEAAKALGARFGVSTATAYRLIAEARSSLSPQGSG